MLTDGDGHGGGIDHVRAGGGDGYLVHIPLCGDGAGDALDAVLGHVGDPDAAALMPAAQHRLEGQRQTGQQLVVAVQHGKAARLQILEDLALGLQDALPGAAQVFDMGVAHVGDNGHGGPYHLAQIADLAEVVHAGLNDGGLMLRREVQQRHRRADGVVEVGLGLQRGKPLAQHGGDHLLGGGLSGAAGDLHHGNIKLRPIPRRQRLQRFQRVGHLNVELVFQQGGGLFRCQAACRAALQRRVQIVVAVEPFAHQRDEQRPVGDTAAVGGDLGHHRAALLQQRAAHGGAQLLYGAAGHLYSAFLALMESSTIFSHRSA